MKTNFILDIHSVLDVITNSSTSVYVGCHSNTIKFATEMINDLLKAAGSEKSADDVFEFKINVDYDNESDRIYDNLEEYYSEEELEGKDFTAKGELARIVFDKMCSGEIEQHSGWGESYGGFDDRNLIITSKTDDTFTMNLASKVESIFSIDGSYDG